MVSDIKYDAAPLEMEHYIRDGFDVSVIYGWLSYKQIELWKDLDECLVLKLWMEVEKNA